MHLKATMYLIFWCCVCEHTWNDVTAACIDRFRHVFIAQQRRLQCLRMTFTRTEKSIVTDCNASEWHLPALRKVLSQAAMPQKRLPAMGKVLSQAAMPQKRLPAMGKVLLQTAMPQNDAITRTGKSIVLFGNLKTNIEMLFNTWG